MIVSILQLMGFPMGKPVNSRASETHAQDSPARRQKVKAQPAKAKVASKAVKATEAKPAAKAAAKPAVKPKAKPVLKAKAARQGRQARDQSSNKGFCENNDRESQQTRSGGSETQNHALCDAWFDCEGEGVAG